MLVYHNRLKPQITSAILSRESYRVYSKVKTQTIANLTHWKARRIETLRRALKSDFDNMNGDPVYHPVLAIKFF